MKDETMQEGGVKTGKEQRRLCAAHPSFILHPSTFSLLAEAPGGVPKLRAILQDEAIEAGTPIDVTTSMELALETIDEAITKLKLAVNPDWIPPLDRPFRLQ